MLHLLLALVALPATAQDPDAENRSTKAEKGVNLRYHYSVVPEFVLDLWWYPTEESLGPRPRIAAQTFGLEYSISPRPATFQIFVDYFHVQMEDGYFDDQDSGNISHTDGDWVEPSNLGMLIVGGHFGHEVALTDDAADTWLGLQFGAGLGFGPGLGRFDRWAPGLGNNANGCLTDVRSAQVRWKVCEADEVTRLPPLMGVIDIGTQLKFHFADHGLLRLDLLLRPIPTFGFAAGGTW